jgi:HSP20 family protein
MFDTGSGNLSPLSKVEVSDEEVMVTFDVPGVNKDDVSVTCTEDAVTIEAEMRKSFVRESRERRESSVEVVRYSKMIQLPVEVDPDRGSARFKNGMIVVKLPRPSRGKSVKISGERNSRGKK